MNETDANDFYQRIVEGTDRYKTISLEHSSGYELPNVEMHPVEKPILADTVERLPDALFEAAQDGESVDSAEAEMEESLSSINRDVVEAFEDLLSESLNHEDLTPTQMDHIIESLDFQPLFELGGDVIELSVEQSGDIANFHERD